MAGISIKKLADLCHRVGTAYQSGLNVKAIWQREAQHGSPRHRTALKEVATEISEGGTVAEGMRAAGDYFPELAVSITEAGEQGGRLGRAFKLLTNHYESILRFRREMQSRLAWPILELAGAIFVIGALILIMGWVMDEPIDWLGLGWSTSGYFSAYLSMVLCLCVGLFVLVYGSKEGWFGNYPMRIARRIPVVGKTIQIFSLARFAWVLSVALESGMNTMRGVGLAFRATQNFYYEQHEQDVMDRIQEGATITEALRETGAFPEDFMLEMESGELAGSVPEAMVRLAELYTAEAEKNLAIIAKVLFFIVFGIIAVIIGLLIITLYQRLYLGTMREFMQ